ncbi:hypothetical protein Btru_016532 [Bulinus truncatus]|nr:hypothetical protein Btru_016532 [Bulinus truncatus]
MVASSLYCHRFHYTTPTTFFFFFIQQPFLPSLSAILSRTFISSSHVKALPQPNLFDSSTSSTVSAASQFISTDSSHSADTVVRQSDPTSASVPKSPDEESSTENPSHLQDCQLPLSYKDPHLTSVVGLADALSLEQLKKNGTIR